MTVACPYCRQALNGHVKRCPHCTTTFHRRFCPKCKQKVPTHYDLREHAMFVRVVVGWYRHERRCIYCNAVLEAWNGD
jgi:uncharacterized protein with PIN domain